MTSLVLQVDPKKHLYSASAITSMAWSMKSVPGTERECFKVQKVRGIWKDLVRNILLEETLLKNIKFEITDFYRILMLRLEGFWGVGKISMLKKFYLIFGLM